MKTPSSIENLVRRFVVEVCESLLKVNSHAPPPEDTTRVRFVHRLVFSKINPQRFTDPNPASSPVPPLNKSVQQITELIDSCPDPEAAEKAVQTLLKSKLLKKKPEVLHLVLLLTQQKSDLEDATPLVRLRRNPGEIYPTGPPRALEAFKHHSVGPNPLGQHPLGQHPPIGDKQLSSETFKPYSDRQLSDRQLSDRHAPDRPISDRQPPIPDRQPPIPDRPVSTYDKSYSEKPDKLPSFYPTSEDNRPAVRAVWPVEEPLRDWRSPMFDQKPVDDSKGPHKAPGEKLMTTTTTSTLGSRVASDNDGTLHPRVEKRRQLSPRSPSRPDMPPSSAWKAPSGPLNSLHRHYSGPVRSTGSMTPVPQSPSVHSDWRLVPPSDERQRQASNKVRAAMSIYPTPRESVALIRDVVFCLQGIDGQHLRYDAHYQRFLLRREIPLSRPIRILAARMASPGNLFMQIHFATAGVGPNQSTTSMPRLTNYSNETSLWKNSDGFIDHNNQPVQTSNTETFRFLVPSASPYRLREHVPGLTVFAFLQHVRTTLSLYYKELGILENDLADLEQNEGVEMLLETLPVPRTVFSSKALRKLIVRLRPASKRVHCLASMVSATAGQVGGELVSTLDEMRKHGNPTRAAVAHEAFERAVVPLVEFVRDWLLEGRLVDEYDEFFVKASADTPQSFYASWKDSLRVDWSLVPTFFPETFVKQILAVGKMAFFIRLVDGPGHFEELRTKRKTELASKEATLLSVVPISDIPSVVVRAMDEVHAQFSMAGGELTPMNYRVDSHHDDTSCDAATNSGAMQLTELGLAPEPLLSMALQGWPSPEVAALQEDLRIAENAHRKDLRHILLERYKLVEHLKAIRSFILLGTGDFAETLMEETAQLIIQTGSVVSIVQSEIDTCITRAIKGSVAARCNPDLVDRLHAIRMTDQERFGHSNWDFFALDYDLSDNPISVVIRDDLRTQYRRLFAFLWKIRRTTKLQHSIWLTTMHNSFLLSFPEVFEILLDVQSLRNEIMHLLQSLESFIFVDIIQPAFEIMISRVREDDWADLDELIEIQESFLQTLLYGTFLDDWPTPNTIGPRLEVAPPNLRPGQRRTRSGTLPDVHSAFLSSSCALPSFFSTRKRIDGDIGGDKTLCEGQGPQLIDDLLECAASFADLMDYLQIAAYDKVKQNLDDMDNASKASEAGTSEFYREHVASVEAIREQFTSRLFAFLDFLQNMRRSYRSDAISSLLIRLDLDDYYEKLKAES